MLIIMNVFVGMGERGGGGSEIDSRLIGMFESDVGVGVGVGEGVKCNIFLCNILND